LCKSKPLSYNTKIKLTAAKYYIPSGRCIQAKDYSNRNEDGSVGEIPDSLIKEFTTLNGRKVYDGGGIRPDIAVKPRSFSKIEISLLSKNLVFDYATQYRLEHDSIPPVEEFEISENTFASFENFLEGKEWDYRTETEEQLEKLIKKAKQEKYYERASKEIKQLEKEISHNKSKDLNEFASPIKELLENEIVSRYYYQAGAIKARLENDGQLDEALSIIQNNEKYNNILSGSIKRHNVKKMKEKLSD
jgi:carboxyl-terminal processing protease